MNKIVVRNKRYKYHGRTPQSWNILTEYQGKDIKPECVIPEWLIAHWNADNSCLGYARFEGLTPEQALFVVGLAKGAKVSLCIDRWGRVSGYKIKLLVCSASAPGVPASCQSRQAQMEATQ